MLLTLEPEARLIAENNSAVDSLEDKIEARIRKKKAQGFKQAGLRDEFDALSKARMKRIINDKRDIWSKQ